MASLLHPGGPAVDLVPAPLELGDRGSGEAALDVEQAAEIAGGNGVGAGRFRLGALGVDYADVVVDSQDEVLWRLRALCGLRNTVGSRIVAIGGPGGECSYGGYRTSFALATHCGSP